MAFSSTKCGDCRGLFLDRGELEHLITAEASFGRGEPSFSRAETGRAETSFGDRSTPPDPRFHRSPQKRKKRSLFEDLFD